MVKLRHYDHLGTARFISFPTYYRKKIEYCDKNPVTRGLVNEAGQWRWSSYNWYQGYRDVPIEIDGLDAV